VPEVTLASAIWISNAWSVGLAPPAKALKTGCAAGTGAFVTVTVRKPGVIPPAIAAESIAVCSCVTSCATDVFVVAAKPATLNDAVAFAFSSPPESPTSLLRCWFAPAPPLNVIA